MCSYQPGSVTTALILRSRGQLSGCSTPLGRRGIFWEIGTEELRRYPHHTRHDVPWWACRFFCRDLAGAQREAPDLPTEERVARFGTQSIIEKLDSLPLEDFQQEFECRFVDESYSFYPYDLILPCTSEELVLADDVTDIKVGDGRLVAGFDVGRTRHRSELALFEDRDGRMVCRLLRRYDQVPFPEQEADLRRLLEHLPVAGSPACHQRTTREPKTPESPGAREPGADPKICSAHGCGSDGRIEAARLGNIG